MTRLQLRQLNRFGAGAAWTAVLVIDRPQPALDRPSFVALVA
jgi:hypothetical protein